ncbi:glycoside hydrolase family 76 protein [Saccharicrinis sp. FJH62]|uniref:glycoside hydrolase family 76 protein n=1 Tax=Saccharicrinis sp. FJH62 TaxID=3344657 RepID=UPI0035D3FDD5
MKLLQLMIVFIIPLIFCSCSQKSGKGNINKADIILSQIYGFYDAGHDNLFNENYPYKQDDKVTYLSEDDTLKGKRVAFLWPSSGVFSAVNTLFLQTQDEKYYELIRTKILPGLHSYFDTTRMPFCYQSYITEVGKSDRYYDDNVWLAIDFCDLYKATNNQEYLKQAELLWEFIWSGWDDKLDGGIYWCEQKKHSKNTCSNAPSAVLALKLYKVTGNKSYFDRGKEIYHWTKTHLQDTTDFLYFDNINLKGRVDQRKYTYNSGQMIQSSALLYNITGEVKYLHEAQQVAASVISFFTKPFITPEGKKIRIFTNTGNWFNAVLFRGYTELFNIDHNPDYILVFKDNLDYLWTHKKDGNGLFGRDWTGEKSEEYKWLLDQASMVEMYARLASTEIQ